MPIIRVEMLPGRSVEQKRQLAEAFTREMVRIGKCSPEAVSIVFQDVPKESWAHAGKLLSDD